MVNRKPETRQRANAPTRKPSLTVRIGEIRMKNPVMLASGTYEYNKATKDLVRPQSLGAVITKTVTVRPTEGNIPPRTCETCGGMLNAIGLQNKGLDNFVKNILPDMRRLKLPIIASIAGKTIKEFKRLAGTLNSISAVAGIELNLSCPNIENGQVFAQDVTLIKDAVAAVKSVAKKTVIAKLSPDVTDIASIARAAEDAGAHAVSLVNTFRAMAVDTAARTPKLGNITGGLSGPAIRPIALRMVWEVSRAVTIPVIGMGGIATPEDALEFIIAGAHAVAVGTAIFVNPLAAGEIVNGIERYLKEHKVKDMQSLVGSLRID